MNHRRIAVLCLALTGLAAAAAAQTERRPLSGHAAFGDWRADMPGLWRRIVPADLPPPGATPSVGEPPETASRPPGALPQVPPGFAVNLFADGLRAPRLLRTAPNGDIFAVESEAGRIRLFRPGPDGAAGKAQVFAVGLVRPFGLALYPESDPRWVYVAETNAVVRFPYRVGDLKPRGKPETVVARIAGGGGNHWTRDIAFSRDGTRMLVSVGSSSNDGEDLPHMGPADLARWVGAHVLGAAWGKETDRAAVLSFTPEGGDRQVFATGLRNCAGLTRQPQTGDFWCSTNERDGLGDNLVPDYVTRIRQGAFYGWPWWYIGDHEDPQHKGERPDLAGKAAVPDVLLQPHSASLQLTFYPAAAGPAAFPLEYRGDGFVALHGSWNRSQRTGYKVVRIKLDHGVPTGAYQDFMTGLMVDADRVWGRPVGVTVARDGSLLVSDDVNGVIWRVAYQGRR